jgi:hypothetical protein
MNLINNATQRLRDLYRTLLDQAQAASQDYYRARNLYIRRLQEELANRGFEEHDRGEICRLARLIGLPEMPRDKPVDAKRHIDLLRRIRNLEKTLYPVAGDERVHVMTYHGRLTGKPCRRDFARIKELGFEATLDPVVDDQERLVMEIHAQLYERIDGYFLARHLRARN